MKGLEIMKKLFGIITAVICAAALSAPAFATESANRDIPGPAGDIPEYEENPPTLGLGENPPTGGAEEEYPTAWVLGENPPTGGADENPPTLGLGENPPTNGAVEYPPTELPTTLRPGENPPTNGGEVDASPNTGASNAFGAEKSICITVLAALGAITFVKKRNNR